MVQLTLGTFAPICSAHESRSSRLFLYAVYRAPTLLRLRRQKWLQNASCADKRPCRQVALPLSALHRIKHSSRCISAAPARYCTLALTLVTAAATVARIVGVAPLAGTFQASDDSTFPLTFLTENSQSPYRDYTAAVGVGLSSEHVDPTSLGSWVANVDFVQINQDVTGTGNFTVPIALPASAFPKGSGNYVLTAVIMQSFGVAWTTAPMYANVTFDAAVPSA